MSQDLFTGLEGTVEYAGIDSPAALTHTAYDNDPLPFGIRMKDHLRIAVRYWHSFNWPGSDMTGARADRYAGWSDDLGTDIPRGAESLEAKVAFGDVDPNPVSGQQAFLENRANQVIRDCGS